MTLAWYHPWASSKVVDSANLNYLGPSANREIFGKHTFAILALHLESLVQQPLSHHLRNEKGTRTRLQF